MTASPELAMIPPASECDQRSSVPSRSARTPANPAAVSASIATIVTAPNAPAVAPASSQRPRLAGSMNSGISGSHGPSTNTTKSVQNVVDLPVSTCW